MKVAKDSRAWQSKRRRIGITKNYRLVGNESSDDDEEDNGINNEREDYFDYQPSNTDSISDSENEDGTQNQTQWATLIEV